MKYRTLNVSEETWDRFQRHLLDVTKELGTRVDADAGVAMLLTQRRTDAEVKQLLKQFLEGTIERKEISVLGNAKGRMGTEMAVVQWEKANIQMLLPLAELEAIIGAKIDKARVPGI